MNVCMCMLSCETLPAERLIHLGLGLLRAAPGELCARQGLACGGGAGGQRLAGQRPSVRKVSRHALRFAASSGQRVLSMRNIWSALKMERPCVMDGEPIGRRWGTHADSMRR